MRERWMVVVEVAAFDKSENDENFSGRKEEKTLGANSKGE